jgi:hypothetical protein
MIVYGGFLYIIGSSTSSVKRGREIITNTGIGLGLLFGIWTILYTINPDLVLLQPLRVQVIQPDKAHIEIVSPSSYEIPKTACEFEMNQAGIPTVLSLYKCAIDVVAKQTGIDPCYLVIGINHESWLALPNSIGHDENPTGRPLGNQGEMYPGRIAFLKNKTTFKGKPIPEGSQDPNDDRVDMSREDLGLDPRYSHGIGLMQFTVKSICGKSWSRRDLLTPYVGILAGAEHIKCNLTKQNALETQQYPGTIAMIWTLWGGCYSGGIAGKCPPFNKTSTIVPNTKGGRTKPTYSCMKSGNPLSFIEPSFFTICRGDLPLDKDACREYIKTNLADFHLNPETACNPPRGCPDSRMPVKCSPQDKVCKLRNPSP